MGMEKSKKVEKVEKEEKIIFLCHDSKKRVVLKIIDNQVMVARFKDMKKSTKDKIVKICKEMSNFDIKKLKKFLNYKITEDEFCS